MRMMGGVVYRQGDGGRVYQYDPILHFGVVLTLERSLRGRHEANSTRGREEDDVGGVLHRKYGRREYQDGDV